MSVSPACRSFVLAALAVALAACASGQPRGPSDRVIARALEGAPGEAQPSDIVRTELAYARAAREEGWVSASRDFATGDAVIHGRSGPVPLIAFANEPDDPEAASEWAPRLVVLSCDGSLALSQGRFRDAEGKVGNYVTVWTRRQDGEYRWIYDVAGRDDPQPAPRAEPEEGDIVVTAMDAVEGLVATCPADDLALTPPGPIAREFAARMASDGTLRWAWAHGPGDTKRIIADYFHEGEWVRAIEESLASPAEE